MPGPQQSLELHMANLPNGNSQLTGIKFLPTVKPADFKFVLSNGTTGPASAVVLADTNSSGTGRRNELANSPEREHPAAYAGRDARRESPPASPQRRVPRDAGTAGGGGRNISAWKGGSAGGSAGRSARASAGGSAERELSASSAVVMQRSDSATAEIGMERPATRSTPAQQAPTHSSMWLRAVDAQGTQGTLATPLQATSGAAKEKGGRDDEKQDAFGHD
jgi:hypothetical protein